MNYHFHYKCMLVKVLFEKVNECSRESLQLACYQSLLVQ